MMCKWLIFMPTLLFNAVKGHLYGRAKDIETRWCMLSLFYRHCLKQFWSKQGPKHGCDTCRHIKHDRTRRFCHPMSQLEA